MGKKIFIGSINMLRKNYNEDLVKLDNLEKTYQFKMIKTAISGTENKSYKVYLK